MAIYFETTNLKKMKIPTIKDTLKREEKKHGKKSVDYTIIKELGDLELSDIAIYAGMFLAKRKQKPYYTISDLKHLLTDRDFIDDELIPLLDKSDKFDKLPTQKKKTAAIELAQNIIDNEAEVIQIVNNYLLAQSTDVTFAHQLSVKQLNELFNIIKNVIETMKTIYDEDDRELKILLNSISWFTDSQKTTSSWLNELLKDVSGAIRLSLRDVKEMKQEGGLSEKEVAALNSLKVKLENFEQELNRFLSANILWPESEHDIDGLKDLRKYITDLEKYRVKAKSVIDQYRKRKDKLIDVKSEDDEDNEILAATGWDDTKLNALIRQTIKDIYDEVISADAIEKQEIVNNKAKELLQTQKGLEKYLSNETYDPEGEIAGLLAKAIADPNIQKGRPKKEEGNI